MSWYCKIYAPWVTNDRREYYMDIVCKWLKLKSTWHKFIILPTASPNFLPTSHGVPFDCADHRTSGNRGHLPRTLAVDHQSYLPRLGSLQVVKQTLYLHQLATFCWCEIYKMSVPMPKVLFCKCVGLKFKDDDEISEDRCLKCKTINLRPFWTGCFHTLWANQIRVLTYESYNVNSFQ